MARIPTPKFAARWNSPNGASGPARRKYARALGGLACGAMLASCGAGAGTEEPLYRTVPAGAGQGAPVGAGDATPVSAPPVRSGASSASQGTGATPSSGTLVGPDSQTPAAPGTAGVAPAAAQLDVLVTQPITAMDMQATQTADVAVSGGNFSGPVTLAVTGLPASATWSFSQAQVDLAAGAKATSTLTIKSGASAPGDVPYSIVATAPGAAGMLAGSLKVNSRLVIQIPQNANTNTKNFDTISLTKGADPIEVVFNNPTSDTVTIHRSAPNDGFSHGSPIAPGQSETRNVTATGNFQFYVHNGQDSANKGALDIK